MLYRNAGKKKIGPIIPQVISCFNEGKLVQVIFTTHDRKKNKNELNYFVIISGVLVIKIKIYRVRKKDLTLKAITQEWIKEIIQLCHLKSIRKFTHENASV